ncbi:MAG: hypothetical protein VYD07_09480 [Pseudomonadota bacterium]|jgi:hypothetical protein|nr:hypothetical protein [Pseudomonadota bacterium]
MNLFSKITFSMALISIFSSNLAWASNLRCKGKIIENRGISSAQIYQKSQTIFLGKVASYTIEKGHSLFPGFYMVDVLDEIKGVKLGTYKVWGERPFEYLPQHYIDITKSHNNMNFEALYGGTTGIVETDKECFIKPKLMVDYNYLILLGIQSELAFEPINSTQFDLFYKKIAAGQ